MIVLGVSGIEKATGNHPFQKNWSGARNFLAPL
jgi:hypothetical protein